MLPPQADRATAAALLALKNRDKLKTLESRVAAVEKITPVPGPRGADGRDGIGKPGLPGRAGKDVSAAMVAAAVESWLRANPPRDGEDGEDAPPPDVQRLALLCREAAEAWLREHREELRGEPGITAEPLPPIKGDKGERGPMGQTPRHEWDGTKLRFEQAPGEWGRWVELRGAPGASGGGGGSVVYRSSGGGASPSPAPNPTPNKRNLIISDTDPGPVTEPTLWIKRAVGASRCQTKLILREP